MDKRSSPDTTGAQFDDNHQAQDSDEVIVVHAATLMEVDGAHVCHLYNMLEMFTSVICMYNVIVPCS